MENMLSKEFVPYEEALALKELGFDEYVLGEYTDIEIGTYYVKQRLSDVRFDYQIKLSFQQAFRWFREEYQRGHYIEWYDDDTYDYITINPELEENEIIDYNEGPFQTYEEAELACLRKLIEIVKENKDE